MLLHDYIKLKQFIFSTVGAQNADHTPRKPYFEVLCVQDPRAFCDISSALEKMTTDKDFIAYRCVTVFSYEEALLAILTNDNILVIILTPEFPLVPSDQLHYVFKVRIH